MRLDRALHDGEAQAAAAGPSRHERLEEALLDLVRDARAVVGDLQPCRRLEIRAVAAIHSAGSMPTRTVTRTGWPRAACTALSSRLAPRGAAGPRRPRGPSSSPSPRPPRPVDRSRDAPAPPGRRPSPPREGRPAPTGGPDPREVEELAEQPGQPVALAHDQAGRVPGRPRSRASTARAARTALRMDASGFLISCASDADSAATASSRSARRWSSCNLLELGDVGEDRRHRRQLAILGLKGGGGEADREQPPVGPHHPLPAANLASMPMPATIAAPRSFDCV